MAAISAAGLLLKALPMFFQVNWVIIALCLPVNAALAYAVWTMSRKDVAQTGKSHLAPSMSGAGPG